MRLQYMSAIVAMVLMAATPRADAQDVAGSADHPLVGRFKGSLIKEQIRSNFDRYVLPLGPADKSEKKFQKQQDVEGKVTKTFYAAPAGASSLAVFRSYQAALQQAGFTTVYTCSAKACSPDGRIQYAIQNTRPANYLYDLGGHSFDDDDAYLLSAHEPKNDVYAVVYVSHVAYDPAHVVYLADVIETKPLTTGLVTVVDAKTMAEDISKAGHVALYGIYFDSGKASLKPESKPALDEIAKLLKLNPSIKLHVVGHTDNVGTLAANMALSKQRADAVVNALAAQYHVAASRLIGNGVGPLAPVAPNTTEDGRAKNRRVELVPQ